MAENQGADHQGGRMVVCSKHGLRYDASKRGGCERCIREWGRQRAGGERAGGQAGLPTTVKILGLVLVAVGLYVLINRSPSEEAAPGNAAPATPQPVAVAGRTAAEEASERALRQVIDDLPELIATGRQETARLLAGADDPESRKQDWEFWALEWSARLQPLADKLPDPTDNPAFALAVHDTGRILNELRAVPQTGEEGAPDPVLVEERFAAAEKALEQARLDLSRLGG